MVSIVCVRRSSASDAKTPEAVSKPKVEAELLLEAHLTPLCAPSVAEHLTNPDNLRREVLLRSYRSDEWPRWFAAVGAACPPLTGPVFDSSLALADIASDGTGVALLPVEMFARRIDERRLVQPFRAAISIGSYFLAWQPDRPPSPAMTDFANWLRTMVVDHRA